MRPSPSLSLLLAASAALTGHAPARADETGAARVRVVDDSATMLDDRVQVFPAWRKAGDDHVMAGREQRADVDIPAPHRVSFHEQRRVPASRHPSRKVGEPCVLALAEIRDLVDFEFEDRGDAGGETISAEAEDGLINGFHL